MYAPCLLVVALALATAAHAQVSTAARAQIAKSQRDAKDLFRHARAAADRAQWDDAAAYGEAILRLGKEHPRVLTLIARCRFKTGKPDVARSLVARALELKPEDAEATALEREMGDRAGTPGTTRAPTTLPARLFGEVSTAGKEALEAYHQDRLEEAFERASSALTADSADPAALYVRALVHRDRLEPDEAQQGIEFLRGRFPRAGFLAYSGFKGADPQREEAFFKEVEADPAPEPAALALLAQYKRKLLQAGLARTILARAVKAVTRPDRESLLAIADTAVDLDERGTASAALDEYKTLFGEDSWWMIHTAALRMNEGKPEEAVRLGEQAYRREPRRLAMLPLTMRFYLTAKKEQELLELLELAHRTYPDRKDIAAQFAVTAQIFLRKLHLKFGDDDIFHLAVLDGLDPKIVGRVLATFKEAHRKIGALFGYFPQKVRLVIFDKIVGMPGAMAYFSPFDDTIYVGAVYYQGRNEVEAFSARSTSEHEFTHYVHAELQRKKGLALRVNEEVGWICEGLAEWASDGLTDRLKSDRESVRAALVSGTVPLHLVESPVTLSTLQGRVKSWYLQGHLMVRYLIELGPDRAQQLDRVVDLSVDLARGDDLEAALKKRFGIDSAAFEKGYTELIRKEAVRLREPTGAGK